MRPVRRPIVLVAFVLIAAACAAASAASPPAPAAAPAAPAGPADTVLLGGRILVFHGIERGVTGEKPRFVQAAAIRAGRLTLLGTDAEVRAAIGPRTSVVDLGGKMVMPGIVDGHFHGTRPTDCEMGYAGGTVAQILAKLQACLDAPEQAALKKSNVRFNATHFFGEAVEPAGTSLTRADLDRLDTTRPIMVRNADGHKFWLNSRAIDNAHLDEKTPAPDGSSIGRDAGGRPDGFFSDYELPDGWGEKRPETAEARLAIVRRTNADASRQGLTTVFVPGGGEDQIEEWAKLRDANLLSVRANLGLSAQFANETTDPAKLAQAVRDLDRYKKYKGGLLDVSSVKIYCDGVMEYPAQTAAMLKPYNVNAGTPGKPIWRPGKARGPDPSCSQGRAGFVALDAAGWQIHVHAIGDRATRDALDNFQAARDKNGDRDLRHTITHLEAIDAADVPRFAKLGVVASMSLQWARRDAYYDSGTVGYIDRDVLDRLYPAAELWRTGAVVAGGSDYPVDPLLPFVQIETAIDHTGEAVPGALPGAISPKEVVSDRLAVIKMHTINPAWQMHREAEFGSLETGKKADLIVLSRDLFEGPVEAISETKVLMTMLEGRIVYRDDAAFPSKEARR